jgi:NitT/TauT family transport system permease protein
MSDRALRIALPAFVLVLVIAVWHAVVQLFAIPPYVLPGPGLVLSTLIADGGLLWNSLLVTLGTTLCSPPSAASAWPFCSASRG